MRGAIVCTLVATILACSTGGALASGHVAVRIARASEESFFLYHNGSTIHTHGLCGSTTGLQFCTTRSLRDTCFDSLGVDVEIAPELYRGLCSVLSPACECITWDLTVAGAQKMSPPGEVRGCTTIHVAESGWVQVIATARTLSTMPTVGAFHKESIEKIVEECRSNQNRDIAYAAVNCQAVDHIYVRCSESPLV